MTKNNVMYKRSGFTIIELFFFIVNLAIILGITIPVFRVAYEHHGLFVGIISGISAVAFSIAIIAAGYWTLFKIGDILTPGRPMYCESRKCILSDCYWVRLGLVEKQVGDFKYKTSIFYYKCRCGNEYLSHDKFFAKVNEDGSLEPFKYYARLGWYDDIRIDSDVHDYAIPVDILHQLRSESTDRSFVFRDKYSCLELCTHCDLARNGD